MTSCGTLSWHITPCHPASKHWETFGAGHHNSESSNVIRSNRRASLLSNVRFYIQTYLTKEVWCNASIKICEFRSMSPMSWVDHGNENDCNCCFMDCWIFPLLQCCWCWCWDLVWMLSAWESGVHTLVLGQGDTSHLKARCLCTDTWCWGTMWPWPWASQHSTLSHSTHHWQRR